MNRSRSRLLSLLLVAILIASTGMSGTVSATTTSGNDATTVETFAVHQGESCTPVAAQGDGSQTVEDFYNYSSAYDYSSAGTTHLQENQVSNLFVYNGSKGYSLVFLHDKHGNAPNASTITFNITGLPEHGDWAVEDDSYGENTDDNFDHYGTRSEIDWMWARHRTDGGAFRGLAAEENVAITIEPGFNEQAEKWEWWPYSGDDANRTEAWRLLDEDGEAATELNMTENVTVETGPCDQTEPSATVSVNSSDLAVDQSVEFDASASTDNEEIVEYRWDFDGDGKVDERTGAPNTTHAYASEGEFNATVTVADAAGNDDADSVAINVTAGDGDTESPTAVLDVPTEADVGVNVTFDASASSDDKEIVEFRWDFDGDGKVDRKTETATTNGSYEKAGEYDATVTVADKGGNTGIANATIHVSAETTDTESPNATLKAPEEATVNRSVSLDASASTDNEEIVEYRWDFDGDGKVDERTGAPNTTHAYASEGEFNATVTVADDAGNTDTANASIDVTPNETDTEPPTATLHVPAEVTANESFTVKATNVTDENEVVHVCWYYDGVDGSNGESMTLSFAEPGDHTVSLRVKDSAGNDRTITRTVTVVANESDQTDDGEDSGDSNTGDDDGSNADDGADGNDPDENDGSNGNDQTDGTDETADDGEETETLLSDISLQAVKASDETVKTDETVEFSVTLENAGEATGSHVVNLSVGGPAADGSTVRDSTEVNLSAGEEHSLTFSTSFTEPGDYDVYFGDQKLKVNVTATETPQQTESPSDTPTETNNDTPTDIATPTDTATPTETDTDAPSEAHSDTSTEDGQNGGGDLAEPPSSATGPGFGIASVVLAAVLGIAALSRRR